jgi:SAM-dependent methyltransferase
VSSAQAIWHDLECGGYAADLPIWQSLVGEHGDPVLEIGAGTGRVSLHLAAAGHRVVALDHDGRLLSELAARADGLNVGTALADARRFRLPDRFATCLVPMQAIQLLGGAEQRISFLRCARAHLLPGGMLAIALVDELECYDTANGNPAPLPDICEREGIVYCSQPVAIRSEPAGFVLERRRERITADGRRCTERDVIRIDRLDSDQLEREAAAASLTPAGRIRLAATSEYSGSAVVMLRG